MPLLTKNAKTPLTPQGAHVSRPAFQQAWTCALPCSTTQYMQLF